ncbi:MAG TPA: protoporphyrinogen oxidase [Acidobacteriota bacterium]|nr:protoporphyrinogen oxidase [Acidobacteriota bacterium]
MRRILVVGAGVAGLATAWALRRDAATRGIPIDVQVLEGGSRAGGRIRTTREDGWTIEWAANAIQGAEGSAWRIAEEAGLAGDRILSRPDAARRYIARGGKLHLVPLDPVSFLRFTGLSPAGRLRVALEPFYARRVPRDETVHDYAVRHIGEEAAVALIGSVVRGVFAGDARRLSLDSAFPLMREMERKHRSLVLAMIAAGKDARAQGKKGPGMAAAAGPGRRALWTLRGGLESFVDALAKPLGPALRLRCPALALERRDAGGFRIRLASGEATEADVVVLTTAPRVSASLIRPIDPEAARELETIPSAGLNVVGLGFQRDAFRGTPDGYGFLAAPGPGDDLNVLGALFESNLFPDRAPEGHVLVRVMIGGAERPDLVTKRDDELVAISMKALDRMVGLNRGLPKAPRW